MEHSLVVIFDAGALDNLELRNIYLRVDRCSCHVDQKSSKNMKSVLSQCQSLVEGGSIHEPRGKHLMPSTWREPCKMPMIKRLSYRCRPVRSHRVQNISHNIRLLLLCKKRWEKLRKCQSFKICTECDFGVSSCIHLVGMLREKMVWWCRRDSVNSGVSSSLCQSSVRKHLLGKKVVPLASYRPPTPGLDIIYKH